MTALLAAEPDPYLSPILPVDLQRQRAALEPAIGAAMARVMEHGRFVNGPEVAELETRLAARLGVAHVLGCSSGTDALLLLLMGAGIGPGDAVIVPPLTFVATAEAVALAGATPVMADVRAEDLTLCPASVARAVAALRTGGGPVPRAVIAVDLFSLPANHAALAEVCAANGLRLFYDAAHSVGTDTPSGPCGSLGDGAATSFYPSKALGCYGDGGAVMTNDPGLATRMRRLIGHGADASGSHVAVGLNARLDTLQAAVLLAKLPAFDAEIARRRAIAARYRAIRAAGCVLPAPAPGVDPVWSYFCLTHSDRDGLRDHLATLGITAVAYYAVPVHRQPAYRGLPVAPGGLPEADRLSAQLLCLPLHPYMTENEVDRVVAAVESYFPIPGAV